MMIWMIACLVVLLFSFVATWGLRRYALATKLMDVPNARSSHSQPTPRGEVLQSFWSSLQRWCGC